jgi:Ca-activated chloride channel family protein
VRNTNDTSDNLQFAAAVAEFGMILRNSEFKGSSSVDEAVRLARSAREMTVKATGRNSSG